MRPVSVSRQTPPPPSPSQNSRRIDADEAGQRVDRYLKRTLPFVPHTLVHKWLRSGQVRLNGARVKADARLSQDDTVRLPPQGTTKSVRTSEEVRTRENVHAFDKKTLTRLRQQILLEQENFFLLDKPAGLACQGGRGVARALDRQLLALAESRPSLGTPRLVHRLDRATSGLLLVAKSRRAAADLASLFRDGKVRKTYCAIVEGNPQENTEGTVVAYGSPLVDKRKGEQEATTLLFLLARNEARDKALVLLRPVSGRKHQLRRHLAAAGTPVLGERLYITPSITPSTTRSATRSQGFEAAGQREAKGEIIEKITKKPARLMLHALRLVIAEEENPNPKKMEKRAKKGVEEHRTQAQVPPRYALDAHLPPPSDFFTACESLCLDSRRLKDARLDPFV